MIENREEDFLWRNHNPICLVWKWYSFTCLKTARLKPQPQTQQLWFKYFCCHQWNQVVLAQQEEEWLHSRLHSREELLVWCHWADANKMQSSIMLTHVSPKKCQAKYFIISKFIPRRRINSVAFISTACSLSPLRPHPVHLVTGGHNQTPLQITSSVDIAITIPTDDCQRQSSSPG